MLYLVEREPCGECGGQGVKEGGIFCGECDGMGFVSLNERSLTPLEAALIANKSRIASILAQQPDAARLLDGKVRVRRRA